MATKLVVWQTEDGKTFDTKADAINHEKTIKLKSWYSGNKLCARAGGPTNPVAFFDLIEWLQVNRMKVAEMLTVKECDKK